MQPVKFNHGAKDRQSQLPNTITTNLTGLAWQELTISRGGELLKLQEEEALRSAGETIIPG
jgi:hypothetical protein